MATQLSPMQVELLTMLASGHSDREVCAALRIGEPVFHREFDAVSQEMVGFEPETLEDYQLLATYERVVRMRTESELWASEARLNALMDTAPDAIFLINGRTGVILKANNQAFMMFGYSPRELVNQPMEILIDPDLRSKHVGLRNGFLNNARKRELGYHPHIEAFTKDGRIIVLEIALTATLATEDVMVLCREIAPLSGEFHDSDFDRMV